MMTEANPMNVERKYSLVKYGSGPWNGKWVVRQTTTQDVGAALDRQGAYRLAEALKAGDVATLGSHAVQGEIE